MGRVIVGKEATVSSNNNNTNKIEGRRKSGGGLNFARVSLGRKHARKKGIREKKHIVRTQNHYMNLDSMMCIV